MKPVGVCVPKQLQSGIQPIKPWSNEIGCIESVPRRRIPNTAKNFHMRCAVRALGQVGRHDGELPNTDAQCCRPHNTKYDAKSGKCHASHPSVKMMMKAIRIHGCLDSPKREGSCGQHQILQPKGYHRLQQLRQHPLKWTLVMQVHPRKHMVRIIMHNENKDKCSRQQHAWKIAKCQGTIRAGYRYVHDVKNVLRCRIPEHNQQLWYFWQFEPLQWAPLPAPIARKQHHISNENGNALREKQGKSEGLQ
mmetsp:Transcript_85101/g.194079  ORF Transcript_85101/g.194079 Transcript_85101/m.194079 type:complete len:249 (+) Transcript_85101:869-1615(+)